MNGTRAVPINSEKYISISLCIYLPCLLLSSAPRLPSSSPSSRIASHDMDPNEFEVLRWATAELLSSHRNEAYLNSLATIESLKQQNELLQQENQELHITAKVTEYVPVLYSPIMLLPP